MLCGGATGLLIIYKTLSRKEIRSKQKWALNVTPDHQRFNVCKGRAKEIADRHIEFWLPRSRLLYSSGAWISDKLPAWILWVFYKEPFRVFTARGSAFSSVGVFRCRATSESTFSCFLVVSKQCKGNVFSP